MSAHDEAVAARLHAWTVAARETKAALAHWRRHPRELAPWILISALLAALLLLGTLVVARSVTPDASNAGQLIAADPTTHVRDYVFVLGHNGVVLALHLLICFATYLARRSLPLQAAQMSGVQRLVHKHASKPAMLVIAALAAFSIVQQAFSLGHALADVAASHDTTPAAVLVRLLPHAVPELVAVFLPLGAALWLGQRDRTKDLLAATVACLVMAVPIILVAGWVEVWLASRLF